MQTNPHCLIWCSADQSQLFYLIRYIVCIFWYSVDQSTLSNLILCWPIGTVYFDTLLTNPHSLIWYSADQSTLSILILCWPIHTVSFDTQLTNRHWYKCPLIRIAYLVTWSMLLLGILVTILWYWLFYNSHE